MAKYIATDDDLNSNASGYITDSEDAASFFKIVENQKFTAKVEMSPDRNDPDKHWPEIGFTGFIYDQDHVLHKEGQSQPDEVVEVDEPW